MMTNPAAKHLVIRASAGSGKTFRLTNCYLSLLADGVLPAEIWAATFTRKAAGEILDRIVSRLTAAAADESKAFELARQIGHPGLTPSDFARLLRNVLTNLHRLRIGTLDSLFLVLAGAFSLELGLPPGWGIVEESDAVAEREQALDAVLACDARRVEQLVRLYERLSPGTAKRAVRADLLDRVKTLYGAYLSVTKAGWQTEPTTKPSGSASAIIEQARAVPLPADQRFVAARDKDLAKAASEQWQGFIEGGFANKILSGENSYFKKPIPPELIACYKSLLGFAAFAINSDLISETTAAYEFLDQFHHHLVATQAAGGGLRFDDITRAVAQGLTPAEAGFAYRIDGGVRHLLLDEFQDTSTLQWQVIKPLALQAMTEGGSVFGVGDVKQAIYGWRGGRAELLDKLPDELGGVATEEMDHSRRSAQAVIDCVNAVFGNIVGCVRDDDTVKKAVEKWQDRFKKHTTARADRLGYVHLETGPAQDEEESTAARRGRHYAWVAGQIAKIVKLKPTATIGVLCRKNPTVGRIIYELRKLGVSASEEGGNPITDSPAVEGILSLLTLADHPGDTIAAFHLASEPFASILRKKGYDPANPSATAQHVRTALMEDGYGPVVTEWAEFLKSICPRTDRDRLDQLIAVADAYQLRATLRPADFVMHVRDCKEATPTTSLVKVLTLHKAKGLEYDAVVLPELDVGLADRHYPAFVVADPDPPTLPHGFVGRRVNKELTSLASEQAREQTEAAARRAVEESLSLLYVALTRPREALYAYPPGPLKNAHPDTWDTLLLTALCGAEAANIKARPAEMLVIEQGDPNWQPEKAAAAPSIVPAMGTIRFGKSDPARRRAEWVAPSHEEVGRRVSAANIFADSDPTGRAIGTLHHAWYAAIEWLELGEPTDEQLRNLACRVPYEGTDLDVQIEKFRQALGRPAVRTVLSKETYPGLLRVEVERPFVVRDGSRMVSGRLDRVVWLRDNDGTLAAEVIDYKTDAIPVAALPERVEFYRPQIEAYLRAVALFGNLPSDRITAALVFTTLGQVVRLCLPGH